MIVIIKLRKTFSFAFASSAGICCLVAQSSLARRVKCVLTGSKVKTNQVRLTRGVRVVVKTRKNEKMKKEKIDNKFCHRRVSLRRWQNLRGVVCPRIYYILCEVARVVARDVWKSSAADAVSEIFRSGYCDDQRSMRQELFKTCVEGFADCSPRYASWMEGQMEEDWF